MAPTIREQFPPLLRDLLPDEFDRESFVEKKATCDNCVMLAPEGVEKSRARDFFHPEIKCCTYHPRMPNYLVGGILADEHDDMALGRERVRKLIAGRTGVTPGWLGPSRKYKVLLEAGRVHGFGRAMSLRCPYFHEEDKNCTIWRYRKSDCAVFYCKYDAMADGRHYWRSIGSYWHMLEQRLSALLVKRVSGDVVEPNLPQHKMSIEELEDRPPKPSDYAHWWGPYEGREEAFFVECFEAATKLTDDDAKELMHGDLPKRQLKVIVDTHQQLAEPRFPDLLKMNPELERHDAPGDLHLCVSYSRYEPMALPDVIYQLLPEFDGKTPVAEVQRRIQDKHGADFADGLVLTMFQQRILVEARKD